MSDFPTPFDEPVEADRASRTPETNAEGSRPMPTPQRFLANSLEAPPHGCNATEIGARACTGWERRVVDILPQVALPEGLLEKTAAAIAQAADKDIGWSETARPTVLFVVEPPKPESREATRRVWLFAGALTVAAAAAMLVAAWARWKEETDWTPGRAAESAALFALGEEKLELDYRASPPPAEFPFSRDVVSLPVQRWRWVEGLLGRRGVAFELPMIEGHRAKLYVIRDVLFEAADSPPDSPDFASGRCAAGVWRRGEVLYILAVVGDRPSWAYSRLVKRPMTPLT